MTASDTSGAGIVHYEIEVSMSHCVQIRYERQYGRTTIPGKRSLEIHTMIFAMAALG